MCKRIKILFITHYSALYGANRSLMTIVEYFHLKSNFEVKVLLPSKGTMVDRLNELGIPCDTHPYYGSFLYLRPKFKHILVPILTLFNLLVFPILLIRVNLYNPTLIYSNTSGENIGIFIAKCLKIKHISHIREFMSLDYDSFFVLGRVAKRRFIGWSDGIIFVSNAVSSYVKNGVNFKSKNEVIYNGIKFEKDIPIPINVPHNLKFGIVGIIDPGKEQLKAIKYFEQILLLYPHASLHIYGTGSGSYYNKVRQRANKVGIKEKIFFHGFVEDTNEIYSFDVLLMFSRAEGFGRVTIEAMMRGIPVIGFDSGGTSELILHGYNGYLFSNFDAFSKSIESLTVSKDNYNAIRMNAYELSRTNFNDEKYIMLVDNFVNDVLISD